MTGRAGIRAVALASGGHDSVVSLAQDREEMEIRLGDFRNYGQRAVERERGAVTAVADYYGLPFREVDVEWLGGISPQGMRARPGTDGAGRPEATGPADDQPVLDTLDAVWIPNRNGVFVNVAAAFAESYRCDVVVTGFNREEAEEFPDNGGDYVARAEAALELSTRNAVRIVSFTQDLDKSGILRLGSRLRAPLSVIWSCYHAGERMCGVCGSCKRLRSALAGMPRDDRPRIEFDI